MKIQIALLGIALLAACTPEGGATQEATATAPAASSTAPAQPEQSAADMGMSEADHAAMAQSAEGMGMSPEAHQAMSASTTGDSADAKAEAIGAGVVKAIDASSGKVTIAHEPIESLQWPAMTMAFNASPDLLSTVKEGDNVRFEFSQNAGASTLSTLQKRD